MAASIPVKSESLSFSLPAIILAAQSIKMGVHHVVIAVGADSASLSPYLLPRRLPLSLPLPTSPTLPLLDSLSIDSYWPSQDTLVDRLATEMSISRDEQDDYAIESFQRAVSAQATGILASEISPVEVESPAGLDQNPLSTQHSGPMVVSADQECSQIDPGRLRALPAIHSTIKGTLTRGNTARLADGAAALLITSAEYAQGHNLPVLARLRGWADISVVCAHPMISIHDLSEINLLHFSDNRGLTKLPAPWHVQLPG
jgi:acetyl-CoA C-acetyltransferase